MRIQFISNYSKLYGANKVLLLILEYFNSNGYKVSVLLPSKGEMSTALEKLNITYTIIPFFSSFLYVKKSLKFLSLPILFLLDCIIFPLILIKINKFKPDLIYSNTSAENIGILVAKFLNVKHISHIHEFMLLDHGAHFIFGNKAKKKYIDKSNGVIYVTNCVANYVNLGQPLTHSKIVIYNGLKNNNWALEEKTLSEQINFGIVGILNPGKGQDIAIKYFKEINTKYPDSKLHLYGDKNGKYKKSLINLVKILNLQENVIFHGFINDVSKIYKEIDILLMFSKSEGFGLVTVEAMLNGVPVLGYNNAGTSEIIENNVTGILFNDYQTFNKGFSLLLDKNYYNEIRKNAYKNAKLKYDVTIFCKKIEHFVNNIYKEN